MINRRVNSDLRTTDETITNIAKEYKLNNAYNAEIYVRGKCGFDNLIDVIEGNRLYISTLYVINKIDKIINEELDLLELLLEKEPEKYYALYNKAICLYGKKEKSEFNNILK